jgi:uncharacterized iron-regulated membrane protein
METLDRPTLPPRSAPAQPARPARAKGGKLVGPRAFKLLWDSHSVVGVVIGLALFVIFYAGAFALYRGELHVWADPLLRSAQPELTMDEVVAPLFAQAPPAPGTDVTVNWEIRERSYYYVRYQTPDGDTTRQIETVINSQTGERVDVTSQTRFSRSSLSEILYKLHFFGQAGIWGELIAGFMAVFLLFAVVSGVLIHLKKLPKDWHTYQTRGTLRTRLADAHTVLGLIGVPFAAMYAISGAFLGLLVILLAPTVLLVFGGDQSMAEDLVAGFEMPPHEATGVPAEMRSFADYRAALPQGWEEQSKLMLMTVHNWGDEAAIVQVYGDAASSLTAGPQIVLSATTGEVLVQNDPAAGSALGGTTAALVNLHYARMGPGTGVAKLLYFWLALATSAVILTGNILWVLVRRPRDPRATPRLHRILARLTVGVGCGLVAAIPVLFLMTALLPKSLPSLVMWENAALFGTWATLVAAAFAGPTPTGAARWQLLLAGVLSLAVPVANGAATGAWPWTSAAAGWGHVLTIDIGFAIMGGALVWTASRLRTARTGEAARAVAA